MSQVLPQEIQNGSKCHLAINLAISSQVRMRRRQMDMYGYVAAGVDRGRLQNLNGERFCP